MGESISVVLVHWHDRELEERREELGALGFVVDAWAHEGSALLRSLRKSPPAVIVIDASTQPMRGRDLAVTLRERASTAEIPLVFVSENEDLTPAQILAEVPDSIFTRWGEIEVALHRAVKVPIPMRARALETAESVAQQVANGDALAAQSSATATPDAPADDVETHDPIEERRRRRAARRRAAREARTEVPAAIEVPELEPIPAAPEPTSDTKLGRLGVREDSRLALLAAPQGFAKTLGRLPAGVKLKTAARGKSDVVVLFAKDRATLDSRLPAAAKSLVPGGWLWMAWPLEGTDLEREHVRNRAIVAGLDDAAIADETKHEAVLEGWASHAFRRSAS